MPNSIVKSEVVSMTPTRLMRLIECLELLRSILDDGKLRDEHVRKAQDLGVWKP